MLRGKAYHVSLSNFREKIMTNKPTKKTVTTALILNDQPCKGPKQKDRYRLDTQTITVYRLPIFHQGITWWWPPRAYQWSRRWTAMRPRCLSAEHKIAYWNDIKNYDKKEKTYRPSLQSSPRKNYPYTNLEFRAEFYGGTVNEGIELNTTSNQPTSLKN